MGNRKMDQIDKGKAGGFFLKWMFGVMLLAAIFPSCKEQEEYTFGLRIRTLKNQYTPSETISFSVFSADGGSYLVSNCDNGHLGVSVMKNSVNGFDGYFDVPCRHDSMHSVTVVFPDAIMDSVSFSPTPGVYFMWLETGITEVGEVFLMSNEFTIE